MAEDLAELKALFPDLSDEQLAAARENIDRYLDAIWFIWQEKRMREKRSFDGGAPHSYDEGKVDSPKQ